MAEHSTIEWTESTWSPITGCTLVSDGCRHCYAAELATTRLRNHPSRVGLARKNAAGEAKFTGEVRFNEGWLDQPLRWKRPRRIFVCAHSDLFHENVPDEWIDRVFAVMALAPQHTFQVLTKRPERARAYLSRPGVSVRVGLDAFGVTLDAHARNPRSTVGSGIVIKATDINPGGLQDWPLPNVWLGTSVEDQAAADARIPALLAAPAALHFLSAEPLLGPLDVTPWLHDSDCALGVEGVCTCSEPREAHVAWVITGGESGRHARPSHPDWFRQIRDACTAAGTAFFHKQNGAWLDQDQFLDAMQAAKLAGIGGKPDAATGTVLVGKKVAGRLLDGREHNDMPEARP